MQLVHWEIEGPVHVLHVVWQQKLSELIANPEGQVLQLLISGPKQVKHVFSQQKYSVLNI